MTPRPLLQRLTILAIIVLFLFSITSYVPLSIRLTDLPSHFVLQYTIGAVVLGVLALLLKIKWRYLFLLGFAFILNSANLAPYIDRTAATTTADSFTVLQANTLYLNKSTKPLQRLIEAEKPDIITAVEVNDAFAEMFQSLADAYPYQFVVPQNNNARGLAVLSKFPLKNKSVVFFSEARVPAQSISLSLRGRTVDVLSLHPFTPIHDLALRDADLRTAAKAYAPPRKNPLIVTGDFNATPWSPIMRQFMATTRLRAARASRGILPSWPVFLPANILRIPIDHVFVSDGIEVLDYRLGSSIGSDHLPTLGIFRLNGAQDIEK